MDWGYIWLQGVLRDGFSFLYIDYRLQVHIHRRTLVLLQVSHRNLCRCCIMSNEMWLVMHWMRWKPRDGKLAGRSCHYRTRSASVNSLLCSQNKWIAIIVFAISFGASV